MTMFHAKIIRCVKLTLALWFSSVLLMLFTTAVIYSGRLETTANESTSISSSVQNSNNHNLPAKRRTETYRQYVERIDACHNSDQLTNESTICKLIEQEKEDFYRKRDKVVNVYPHRFVIGADDLCDKSVAMVILVHSLHSYSDRRNAIRRTWGGAAVSNKWPNVHVEINIKLLFVFGIHQNNSFNQLIIDESKQHQDIIQGDFNEHYNNMTLKSLLGLKWVTEYCPGARYLLKSDDDMFINIPAIVQVLEKTPMSRSIMGPYNNNARVLRRGKWGLKETEFPFYYFPPYESGSAYIISVDILSELYQTAAYVPWIFIDDVYITGILAKIIGAKHVLRPGFAYWNTKRLDACAFIENKVLTSTKMTPVHLLQTWDGIVNGEC